MAARNPWQKLKDEALRIRTPTQILQEQIRYLQDATDEVIRGRVKAEDAGNSALLTLRVYVPTLNNYSIDLLEVVHPIVQYPATVRSQWLKEPPLECKNSDELEAIVVTCLEKPELQRLVTGLFAQASHGE